MATLIPQQQNNVNNGKVQPPQSLLKYGNPILVSSGQRKSLQFSKKGDDKKAVKQNVTHTEDILNSILPPREYVMEKQQLWIQCVSPTPSTKQDVLELQDKLDKRLQQRQARETGICPIREELYSQCYDELIRQITINCSERGLLLVRARDEFRMIIQTYQTLYESSIAFGMRKYLQEQQKKAEMSSRIDKLQNECLELSQQVESLNRKIHEIYDHDIEQQQIDSENHQNEILQLRLVTKQKVTNELDKILNGQIKIQEKKSIQIV